MAGRIDNDTRGWIMCIVSGVCAPVKAQRPRSNMNSLHARSQYHLCRYSSPMHTEQEKFQDTRQQCLPSVVIELEFRCHGKDLATAS
jgi:hypothetical protein